MRHHRHTRTLSRTRRARSALLRGLALSLAEKGRITTTEAKAKELRPFIERLITHAKEDSVATRRLIASRLGEPRDGALRALFARAVAAGNRAGGYTRIIKMGQTNAGRREAVMEFV